MGPGRPVRIVLDTNTLISALLFQKDRWTWLREAWKSGAVVPVVCRQTVQELIRVLAYPKFRLDPADQQALLEDLLPYCETLKELPPDALEPCRDPKDQIFLLLAQAASVVLLVSGDDDLLTYPGKVGFAIVPPAHLRTLLDKEP